MGGVDSQGALPWFDVPLFLWNRSLALQGWEDILNESSHILLRRINKTRVPIAHGDSRQEGSLWELPLGNRHGAIPKVQRDLAWKLALELGIP